MHVGQVAGKPPGDDEDRIHPYLVAVPSISGGQQFDRAADAAQPPLVERQIRAASARSGLDLDEGQGSAAAGDQVDLSHGRPRAAGENSPALQPKPPGRDLLGPATAALGPAPRVGQSAVPDSICALA